MRHTQVTIQVRIPKELHDRLVQAARELDSRHPNVSRVVRRALYVKFPRPSPDPPPERAD